MTRRTTVLPLFILSNEQLIQLAKALQEVENELFVERGADLQSRQCVEDLLAELDRRGDTYQLQDGNIIRKS